MSRNGAAVKNLQKQQIVIGCVLDGCLVLEVIQQFVSTPP
jgi:hypothetical protein